MKIIDKVRVLGRGWILVCDEAAPHVLHIDDEIVKNGTTFRIRGIEMMSHSVKLGLILSPNDSVDDTFSVGDVIEEVINKPKE